MPQQKRITSSDAQKTKRRRQGDAGSTPVAAAIGLAGFDFEGYNRQFLRRTGAAAANGAERYGARIEIFAAQPGQVYWKVIGIHHLAPDENRDRHNAFIEALDENGRRLKDNNLRVGSIWEGKSDGPDRPKPLDKPDGEPAADVPIEKDMTMTIWLEGAGPSERVTNLHTRHEDEVGPGGGRSSRFHHSYYIVFQRTQAAAAGGETGGQTGGETGGETGTHPGDNGATPPPAGFRFLRWPTDHLEIIQPFGANPAIYAPFGLPGHEGVDIVAAENEPIYCVAPGTVSMVNTPEAYAANNHPYGIHVRVQHQDEYETIYAHFKLLHVTAGQAVEAGQVLGLADHTGHVFGDPPDHLHLTLKHAGETAPGYRSNIVDPTPFLLPLQGGADQGPRARYIADLDATLDGSVLLPGTSFTKIWQMVNTGTTAWGEGYQFVLVDGPSLGAQHRLPAPPCLPGQTTAVTVAFVTPPNPGEYTSTWSLVDPQGNLFGPPVWTRIVVAEGEAAPAAVPAAAPAFAAAALPAAALPAGASPLLAAAVGIIYQTYWLRVLAAASAPDAQQAIQAAGDDAVARLQALLAHG